MLSDLASHLDGYDHTRGSLHFRHDEALRDDLVRRLVEARLALVGHARSDGSSPAT